MKKMILALAALTAFETHAGARLDQVFSDVTLNKPACFTREYSPAHMRSKPRQTVERIKVKLKKVKYDEGDIAIGNVLAIQVKRKNENKVWTNNIMCEEYEGKVRCAVECDGGSVEIVSRKTAGELVLKNNGVLLYGGCGAEGPNGEEVEHIFLESKRGGDDVFKLQGADASACADVSDEAH